ncbi:phosphohydrolase [Candidatus Dojkabacteria bacterium]|nr:phosphohydrolase [Candidatus Dojkabacteria bacterium]
MIGYLSVIQKYIKPDSSLYRNYIIHVTLVTNKALEIARGIELGSEQLQFIEEASMLHDIGICMVDAPEIGAKVSEPYIRHIVEGKLILEKENLPKHAVVALTHIGVGITKKEIISRELPLPKKDIYPETLEEKIISYADLFFSKEPRKYWIEKTKAQVKQELSRYGEQHIEIFNDWDRELSA